MKRNENIQELSRDHHFGLLFCWKIRKGVAHQIETTRINRYVNYFWQSSLQPHFREEETILFNQLQDQLCDNGIRQHRAISLLIEELNANQKSKIEAYMKLADLVDEHIRFEERVLFPYMEKMLSESQLSAIGIALAREPRQAIIDEYPDPFWD